MRQSVSEAYEEREVTEAVMDLRDTWNTLPMERRAEIAEIICQLWAMRQPSMQDAMDAALKHPAVKKALADVQAAWPTELESPSPLQTLRAGIKLVKDLGGTVTTEIPKSVRIPQDTEFYDND